MKKKALFLLLPLMGLALASCGGEEAPSKTTTTTVVDSGDTTTTADTEATTSVDETKMQFQATVLMPDGTPCQEAKVQWCSLSGNCFTPTAVDTNGVATISLDKTLTYTVHLTKLPTGYGYNPFELQENADSATGTIHLFQLNEATGEGTEDNPYQVTKGNYSFKLEAGTIYYLTLTVESGKQYVVEGLAADFNTKIADAKGRDEGNKKTGNGKNFKYTVAPNADSETWSLMLIAERKELFYVTITEVE